MKTLDYENLYQKVIDFLKETNEMVLATSDKDRVSARTINCVCNEMTIYFMTSKAYTKYKQIKKNSQVALVRDKLQIEGKAVILGHPLENDEFKLICEESAVNQMYYQKYAHYKNTVLIKVVPSLCTFYEGRGVFHYLDLIDKKGYGKGI